MMFGGLGMLIVLGLVVWVVYTVAGRQKTNEESRAVEQPSALDILERRYANGELTSEQFEAMRRELAETSTSKGA
jgi:putative membrane protein